MTRSDSTLGHSVIAGLAVPSPALDYMSECPRARHRIPVCCTLSRLMVSLFFKGKMHLRWWLTWKSQTLDAMQSCEVMLGFRLASDITQTYITQTESVISESKDFLVTIRLQIYDISGAVWSVVSAVCNMHCDLFSKQKHITKYHQRHQVITWKCVGHLERWQVSICCSL